MKEVHLPSEWSEWKVVETIGSGSYGIVYRAERYLGSDVINSAIKIIEIAPDAKNLMMMLVSYKSEKAVKEYYWDLVQEVTKEIKTMNYFKGLSNIVTVEDYYVEEQKDKIGWNIYIRMEYLKSFSNYLLEHTINEKDVITLGIHICTALEYCDARNIIHMDIKPENIMVSDFGEYKLGDFGVAKQMDKTRIQYSARGTAVYMAPEVYHGLPYGIQADIYSLGIVMYRLMNRFHEPFVDIEKETIFYKDREEAVLRRMRGEEVLPPADASETLGKIIQKACQYQMEKRYKTPGDMKKDLQALLEGKEVSVVSDGSEQEDAKKQKSKKRIRRISIAAVMLAVLVGAAGTVVMLNRDSGSQDEMVESDVIQEDVVEEDSVELAEFEEPEDDVEWTEFEEAEDEVEWTEFEEAEDDVELTGFEESDDDAEVTDPEEIAGDSETLSDDGEVEENSGNVIAQTEDSDKISVGDICTFGSYEQDNNPLNGAEPIEWEVLDVKDGKALLLSKYGLDEKAYHDNDESVTWENCTLRQWLNNDFLGNAFSLDEQEMIEETTVFTLDNRKYETPGGNDTVDKIFLLSLEEMIQYYGVNSYNGGKSDRLKKKPTAYAIREGALPSFGYCCWLLRSPGDMSNSSSFVFYDGSIYYEGSPVVQMDCVCPALWVDLNQISRVPEETDSNEGSEKISVGDTFTFGSYEQDNNPLNGAEPIEWEVLDVKDGKALLLSKYGLDYKVYHDKEESVTWETCTLRQWLNNDFLEKAFSIDEQDMIEETTVFTLDNRKFGTPGGNNTVDKIFLLSLEDMIEYYGLNAYNWDESERLKRKPTAYAIREGALTITEMDVKDNPDSFSESEIGYSCWHLRSPGDMSSNSSFIIYDGAVYCDGSPVDQAECVCPALWVDLKS